MITHRICCLVLIAIALGGCGPGVRSVHQEPVWPPPTELSERSEPPTRPSVRVRKSSGFAESEAGFVKLAPVEDEIPTPTPVPQEVTKEVVSQPKSEPVKEPTKMEDERQETRATPTSEKKALDVLPPPTIFEPVVATAEPEKKSASSETPRETSHRADVKTSVASGPEPTKKTEDVVEAKQVEEISVPSVSPPSTPTDIDAETVPTNPPPTPVASLPKTSAVESEKEPTTGIPPGSWVRSPVAEVTDPMKGITTSIPLFSGIPAPGTGSPPIAPMTPPPVTGSADPKKGVTTITPAFVTPPVSTAPLESAKPSVGDTVPSVPPAPTVASAEKAPETTVPPPGVPNASVPSSPTAIDTTQVSTPNADRDLASLRQESPIGAINQPPGPSPLDPGKTSGLFTPANQDRSDPERLAELWAKRRQGSAGAEYPVGPGDVLTINVPGMDELKEQTVRVGTDGTIALPLVGNIGTTGMSGNQVREEIRRRLAADFMHNPQVQLFVKEYRSRQVAVVGAVAKPGLYTLTSGTETILEMLSEAGGVTTEAASYLQFVPAQPIENGAIKEIAATIPEAVTNAHPGLLLMEKTDPLLIDLQNQTARNSQTYLLLPVWPGDVIMVPGGGEVLIDGWVAKPGSYKISRGLTVLGAIAAAGGSLFAADTSAVKVMRVKNQGDKAIFVANLDEIRAGKQQDIPVQGGDVIEVTASTAKLVPYGMYKFISTIFRVGASAPLY